MGRGKIELKKIEKANSLQVRFTNRRKVLMKKANHLSISVTRTSPLSSSPTPASMEQILSRYGYSAADHRLREQQQLLLCSSSQENGVVLRKDEYMTSEFKRLQLAIDQLNDSLLSVKDQKEKRALGENRLLRKQIESMVGRGSSGPQVEPESSSSDEDDENDNHY
ncbi:Agamous-like MADS-box protein AGL18 [Raphanus sativus]|nr:Agamous-like MADS-box protein AGL18 [Raphanus sativus]